MIPALDSNLQNILVHFYNRLATSLARSRSHLERKSLFLTMVRLPVNQLSKLMKESALDNLSFAERDLGQLARDGYIRLTDDVGKSHAYTITAKGIWYIEATKNEMDLPRLFDYFQETKLSPGTGKKPLTEIEKIILYSMMSMRTFSTLGAMDITEASVGDAWIEVFDMSAKHLRLIGAIAKQEWSTSRRGNEHPVAYVMRRANDLPQKTKHIYVPLGKNRYFLDVERLGESPRPRLLILCRALLGRIENKETVDMIYEFLCDMAYDKSKLVRENLEFVTPEWDTVLRESLDEFYYGM